MVAMERICTQSYRMALLPDANGGSATGVLITDKSREPGCDRSSVRLNSSEYQSFVATAKKGFRTDSPRKQNTVHRQPQRERIRRTKTALDSLF